MNSPQTDEQRFAENLPFYVNGSLATDEQDWMAASLAQHPQWQTDVDQARQERIDCQAVCSDVAESVRLARIRSQLAWPETGVQTQATPKQNPRTVLTHPWLTGLSGMLLGAALALGIGLFMPHMNPTPNDASVSAMHRGERRDCAAAPDIRLALSPSTRWEDLTQLLRQLELQLVSGPNQDGEVWVRANSAAPLPETLRQLRNSPSIEQAMPANVTTAMKPCQP